MPVLPKNEPDAAAAGGICGLETGGAGFGGGLLDGGAGLGGADDVGLVLLDVGGGTGRGGGALTSTSTFGGSRGSKLFDSEIAARRSSKAEVLRRWPGEGSRQPLTRS